MLALALIAAAGACGQSPEPLTVTWSGGTMTITNNSNATVVAFVIGREQFGPGGPDTRTRLAMGYHYFDVVTAPPDDKSIPPHSSVTVGAALDSPEPPRILAALFDNGTVWGEAEWAAKLTLRRQYLEEAFHSMLAKLEAASLNGDMTLSVLVKQFEADMRQEANAPRTKEQHDARTGLVNNGWLPVCTHLRQAMNSGAAISLSDVIRKEIDFLQGRLKVLKGDAASTPR